LLIFLPSATILTGAICDSKEQFQDAQREFMELYMFFNWNFRDRDEDLRKRMHRVAYHIELNFDRNVFKMQVIRGYLPGSL
jgi:hypothetical protein